MEDPDGLISRYTRDEDKCWRVKPGTSFFDVYDSDFRKVLEFTVFNSKMPKGFHRQVAALDTLSGKATTESGTSGKTGPMARAVALPPAPYKALPKGTKIKYDDRIYRVTKSSGPLPHLLADRSGHYGVRVHVFCCRAPGFQWRHHP